MPKRIRKSKKISLGHEWGQKLRKIFPESEHNSALDVMALFNLNRFRTKIYHKKVGTEEMLTIYKGSDTLAISELAKIELLSSIY